jgi:hypothetical protein
LWLRLCRAKNSTVDFIVQTRTTTKENEKFRYFLHTRALSTLSGQFDAARAARVADAIIAILGDGTTIGASREEFVTSPMIPKDLAKVAERLDAPGGLRAAEALIPVLTRAEHISLNMESLRTALVSVCRRLDEAGSARVADALAAAVQDPKTPVLARSLLASGFAVFGDRLDPGKAAALESVIALSLIADLADAKSLYARGRVGEALGSVGGRPGAKSAARAAQALTAAIGDPQTPVVFLKPLAAALAVTCGQLPPAEASSHAS